MKTIIIFNTILFIAVILSLYTLIFQYRTKDKVVVKGKLLKRHLINSRFSMIFLVICSIIVVITIMMLLYASIEEFHSTKSFRDEYEIKFGSLINEREIEKTINELDGRNKEWGEWSLKQIKQSKILLIYVINMLCFIAIFPKIARIRIEKEGIRRFTSLTSWEEYLSYSWKNDEINFTARESNLGTKIRIDDQEKDTIDRFLNEKTALVELST